MRGNFGCVEAYLSGVGFCTRLAKKMGQKYIKGQIAMELAQSGDPLAVSAFEEYAELMAQAIAS
ncbi:MAG: ROK family protein [Bdellovibrionales bacterium]